MLHWVGLLGVYFSSGHMRTSKKALYEFIKKQDKYTNNSIIIMLVGLLTKEMHDEDYSLGLNVSNKKAKEKVWETKSDHCYMDIPKDINELAAINAMTAGLESIFHHYTCSPDAKTENDICFGALDFIPTPTSKTINPLFKDGSIRKNVNDPKCNEYEVNWDAIEVLRQRKVFRKAADGKEALPLNIQTLLEKELKVLEATTQTIECKIM